MNKPLFAVIYPYKFTDFVYDLAELDHFKRYCEVLVLDTSLITAPGFSKGVSAERSRKGEVVAVTSWRDFFERIHELRKRSAETNICIQNVVPYSSVSGFLCNLVITVLLRGRGAAVFDLFISGTPVHQPGAASKPDEPTRLPMFLDKVLRFAKHTTTLSEAVKKVSGVLLHALARRMPSALTHRLVAGEDWEALARVSPGNNRIRLVYGHSHDYSNNLLHKRHPSISALPHERKAVLLDAAAPMFGDDYIYMSRKVYLTSDVWYPALTRFFDRLEAETGVRVEIAGHYKSTHPPIASCFGNRPVHYGKTRELVRNSEFVMTRQSAAVSYAVIFRKPVIFIYSNQIKEDGRAMRGIRNLSALFGVEPVNIDEPPAEMGDLLKVNEDRYLQYEKACLTSARSQRPNVQIILEDIMNIATEPELHSEVPENVELQVGEIN